MNIHSGSPRFNWNGIKEASEPEKDRESVCVCQRERERKRQKTQSDIIPNHYHAKTEPNNRNDLPQTSPGLRENPTLPTIHSFLVFVLLAGIWREEQPSLMLRDTKLSNSAVSFAGCDVRLSLSLSTCLSIIGDVQVFLGLGFSFANSGDQSKENLFGWSFEV